MLMVRSVDHSFCLAAKVEISPKHEKRFQASIQTLPKYDDQADFDRFRLAFTREAKAVNCARRLADSILSQRGEQTMNIELQITTSHAQPQSANVRSKPTRTLALNPDRVGSGFIPKYALQALQ